MLQIARLSSGQSHHIYIYDQWQLSRWRGKRRRSRGLGGLRCASSAAMSRVAHTRLRAPGALKIARMLDMIYLRLAGFMRRWLTASRRARSALLQHGADFSLSGRRLTEETTFPM